MAHEILIENGQASMMYVGEAPWHGLGTKLDQPATAAEAIVAANLDWKVVKRPIYAVGDGCMFPIRHKEAILRKGEPGQPDGPVFGIVSTQYTPLQNSEAFEFFDNIVKGKQAIYHTAGALGRGERIWILAKLPDSIRVVGDDITDKYLLLSNSHDASSSVQVKFTPIRVVCQNTLTMALSQGRTIRIPHTGDMIEQLNQAQDLLGLVQSEYANIEANFQAMARVQMDSQRLDSYLHRIFPDPVQWVVAGLSCGPRHHCSVGPPSVADERMKTNRLWAEYFFENGQGNQAAGVKGTLWAAYNGVTELIDHRKTGMNDERRLRSAWFGEGYLTKARAYRMAVERALAWKN